MKNHKLFSESFAFRSNEEFEWMNGIVNINIKDRFTNNILSTILKEKGINISYLDSLCWVDFRYEINASRIEFISESTSDLTIIAAIMQAFIRKFRPNECFALEWSKDSENHQFGGGALFITAEYVKEINTKNWIEESMRQFDSFKKTSASIKSL